VPSSQLGLIALRHSTPCGISVGFEIVTDWPLATPTSEGIQ
jgi:hypothetical protein